MPRLRSLALLAAAFLAAASGCGYERSKPPDVATPEPPASFQKRSFKKEGLALKAPANWRPTLGQAPLVVTFTSGRATLAVWRYPRSERLPKDRIEVAKVLPALLEAARGRDPALRVSKKRLVTVDGVPGVALTGSETILGQRRRVRSVHLYTDGAEIVIDAFAPPAVFARIDRQVFRTVVRSVTLRGRGRR